VDVDPEQGGHARRGGSWLDDLHLHPRHQVHGPAMDLYAKTLTLAFAVAFRGKAFLGIQDVLTDNGVVDM
jgi:hypothetical protein